MKITSEMSILEKLRSMIVASLSSYYSLVSYSSMLKTLTNDNVVIDYPDIDAMKKDVMIYIIQDNEAVEACSMGVDKSVLDCKLYLFVKGDNSANILKMLDGYFNSLYCLIRDHNTLDGYVSFLAMTNMDFYPPVKEGRSLVGMEITFNIEWEKWKK